MDQIKWGIIISLLLIIAIKLNDKTRWIANAKFEYDIFNLADEHDERVLRDEPLIRNLRWVNDDNKGLYAISVQ